MGRAEILSWHLTKPNRILRLGLEHGGRLTEKTTEADRGVWKNLMLQRLGKGFSQNTHSETPSGGLSSCSP